MFDLGPMWLVAGIARYALCVICCCDLRKVLGLSGIGFMAAGTDHSRMNLRRLYRGRIIGVLRLRSMTRFARDNDMLAEFLLVNNVGMASLAYIMAGVRNGPGCNFRNGIAPIMSVSAERLGNHGGTQQDEGDQRDAHYDCEPDKVFEVLEQKKSLPS